MPPEKKMEIYEENEIKKKSPMFFELHQIVRILVDKPNVYDVRITALYIIP